MTRAIYGFELKAAALALEALEALDGQLTGKFDAFCVSLGPVKLLTHDETMGTLEPVDDFWAYVPAGGGSV